MGSSEEILMLTVNQENVEVVEAILKTGVDLNFRHKGVSPLVCATGKGNYELVKMLIDYGADVNYPGILDENEDGSSNSESVYRWSPLDSAAFLGFPEILELLIERGANVNERDKNGRTSLLCALQRGQEKCAQILVKNGATVTEKNSEQSCFFDINLKTLVKKNVKKMKQSPTSPLHIAAMEGNCELMNEMLKLGININLKDQKGNTPLHIAIENCQLECVEVLLKKGANKNAKGNNGNAPVHLAAALGYASIIPMLVEKGAKVNVKNNDGLTPLLFAVFHNRVTCVEQLLDHGADIHATFVDGKTPLHIAVSLTNDCIELLLKSNADVFAKDDDGECPIDVAVEKDLSCFKKLFPKKYNVISPEGVTALHLAARSSQVDSLKFLMKDGCNVNVETQNGDTPLHYACSFDKEYGQSFYSFPSDCGAHLLLEAGADVNKKNKMGLAPVHVAALRGNIAAMNVLNKHGANLNTPGSNKKRTPLHCAAFIGSLRTCSFLLDNGADKNAVDVDKCTALMLTAKKANVHCVRLLLEFDAPLWVD